MKKTGFILILLTLVGIGINISCESDDICASSTSTTPSLIIDAYDVSDTEEAKSITNLVVIGEDNDAVLSGYNIADVTQIVLPLKTDSNVTRYMLIKDAFVNDNGTPDNSSDDYYDGNPDVITISYSRENVYVSRACGYKTIFNDVTLTIESDSDNWIKSRQPLNDNQSVEDETETHFNIFH